MKKYGVPNKWDVAAKKLRIYLRNYIEANDIKKVIFGFRKDIVSPCVASLLNSVCGPCNVELIYVSFLESDEKLPKEVLDIYGNDLWAISKKEQQFLNKTYSLDEKFELQNTLLYKLLDDNMQVIIVNPITKTEDMLGLHLVRETDFCLFKELWGTEIFELAKFLEVPGSYIESLENSQNKFIPRSQSDYQEADSIIQKYIALKEMKNLPQISYESIDKELEELQQQPCIALIENKNKRKIMDTFVKRDYLFEYGEKFLK